jgi:hypothetical protein
MTKRNKHIGSSLDKFLMEEGVLAETRAVGHQGCNRLAGSAGYGEGQDHQGRNGEADAHQPGRAGPPACARQCLCHGPNLNQSRACPWS